MLEEFLIKHCAPTLASLKAASLFSISGYTETELQNQIEAINARFYEKGILLMILKYQCDKALVYIYRSSHLESDLKKSGVKRFLSKYGYESIETGYALRRLKSRLEESISFPHEIGVFLGYPLEDVVGFIENEGKNCKCTGCWKVYCNECEALKQFTRIHKCRAIYARLWNEGRSVWQLTVAA